MLNQVVRHWVYGLVVLDRVLVCSLVVLSLEHSQDFKGAWTSWNASTDFATGATIGNTAGFQGFQPTAGGFYTTRDRNFRFKCKIQNDALTNRRIFIGFASVGPLPALTDTYLATAIPGFGFRYSRYN